MNDSVTHLAEWMAGMVELIGIGIIGAVSFFVVLYFVFELVKRRALHEAYDRLRQVLGRGIMIGLEFLVAADIIHTVAVELTFRTVGVLAIIVAIRTFLSFTLELELTGRWPWQEGSSRQSKG